MTPAKILATVTAVLWHERSTPWRYPSVRFRDVQLAHRVLRLAPTGYSARAGAPHDANLYGHYGRTAPILAREYWGRRLVSVLGVLAVKIADAIEAQPPPEDVLRDPECLPGISEPFTT